jgi:hypothetical protein
MSRVKTLIRKSHTLWDSPLVPQRLARHNRKAWVRSVLFLGDKWLLARKVERLQ